MKNVKIVKFVIAVLIPAVIYLLEVVLQRKLEREASELYLKEYHLKLDNDDLEVKAQRRAKEILLERWNRGVYRTDEELRSANDVLYESEKIALRFDK